MKAMSNSDFAEKVMQMASPAETFKPSATYDRDGDCIEFLAKPDNFYAERIDDLVTVYYSQETKEVVGSLIKGVSSVCREVLQKYPGFTIEIHDGKVKLAHFFRAHLWSKPESKNEIIKRTYKKLIEYAQESQIEAELCPL